MPKIPFWAVVTLVGLACLVIGILIAQGLAHDVSGLLPNGG